MVCFTRHIRTALLMALSFGAAHMPGYAQIRAFSFSEHGRLFLTSPTYWMASRSAERNSVASQTQGSAAYAYGSNQFLGAQVSGQYFFHGLFLGYGLGAGVTPKADAATTGANYVDRTRHYNADLTAQAGLVALSGNGFNLIPSYGFGYGVWATHYQQLAQESSTGSVGDTKESAAFTTHYVHDVGLQALYVLPAKTDGGSRFTIGLKGGYKIYQGTNTVRTVQDKISSPSSLGTQGAYLQLNLGMGILRPR